MRKFLTVLILVLNIATLSADEIYATFDVLAKESSDLGLSQSGIVKKIYVDVGSQVKKGDLLLELDNSKELIEADLAEDRLKAAQINHDHTLATFHRYEAVKDVIDKELFSKYTLDKELKSTELSVATNELKLREDIVKKRKLFAPYAGVITKKSVDVGDSAIAFQSNLLSMINSPEVKLLLSFDEKYYSKVKKGAKFIYTLDGFSEKFEGVIEKIYPSIDKNSRKVKAEVISKNIPVGIFGDGTIISE
jgi:RND family efflux transporter MFP subunit